MADEKCVGEIAGYFTHTFAVDAEYMQFGDCRGRTPLNDRGAVKGCNSKPR